MLCLILTQIQVKDVPVRMGTLVLDPSNCRIVGHTVAKAGSSKPETKPEPAAPTPAGSILSTTAPSRLATSSSRMVSEVVHNPDRKSNGEAAAVVKSITTASGSLAPATTTAAPSTKQVSLFKRLSEAKSSSSSETAAVTVQNSVVTSLLGSALKRKRETLDLTSDAEDEPAVSTSANTAEDDTVKDSGNVVGDDTAQAPSLSDCSHLDINRRPSSVWVRCMI